MELEAHPPSMGSLIRIAEVEIEKSYKRTFKLKYHHTVEKSSYKRTSKLKCHHTNLNT